MIGRGGIEPDRVLHHASSHLHTEGGGQRGDGVAKGVVIRDDEQGAALPHPAPHEGDLFRPECRTVPLLARAHRIHDGQYAHPGEALLAEAGGRIRTHDVPVVLEEAGERSIGGAHSVPVVVPFVEEHQRVGVPIHGPIDGHIERGIGTLSLGRGEPHRGNEEQGSGKNRDETLHPCLGS